MQGGFVHRGACGRERDVAETGRSERGEPSCKPPWTEEGSPGPRRSAAGAGTTN